MNKVIEELNKFKNLENDWDGYGAIPITKESFNNTLKLIEKISIEDTFLEDIYPNPNGTVTLNFNNNVDVFIDLEIGDFEMSYYVKTKDRATIYKDHKSFDSNDCEELRIFLEMMRY